MEAAAADSPRVNVGRTQKGGGNLDAAKVVRHNHISTSPNGWPGIALSTKNIDATMSGTAVCSLRSPVRSDDLPESSTATIPKSGGKAAQAVAATTERFDER